MRVWLWAIAMLLCCKSAIAQQRFFWEGIKYEITSEENRTVMIYAVQRCVSDFKVPKTVPYRGVDYAVTEVGCDAFQFSDCVVHLDLGDVETIEDGYIERTDNNRVVIFHGAFAGCKKMVSVKFRKVKSIGDFAFHGCTGLTSVRLDGIESIGRGAFYECTNLAEVDFRNVRTIRSGSEVPGRGSSGMIYLGAFAECPHLAALDTKKVETLGDYTFHGAKGLQKVVLGEALQSVGTGAFAAAEAIDQVRVSSKNPPVCAADAFTSKVYSDALLQVPVGTTAQYRSAEGWRAFLHTDEGTCSGILSAEADGQGVTVSVAGGSVTVEGAPRNTAVSVLDFCGRTVQCYQSDGKPLHFTLPSGKLYLLRVGQTTYKLAM